MKVRKRNNDFKNFLALPWHNKIQDFSIVAMPFSLTASWATVPQSDHTIQTSSVDKRRWMIPLQSDYPTLKKNQIGIMQIVLAPLSS